MNVTSLFLHHFSRCHKLLRRHAARARLLCLALVCGPALPAPAQRVLTECTPAALQSAVEKGGMIRISCNGTIVLTNTLLITRDTSLDASGYQVVIRGDAESFRLFRVETTNTLTLIKMTLADGFSTQGGAIYNNRGTVNLTDCIFSNNVAQAEDGAEGVRGRAKPLTNGRDGGSGGGGRSAFGGAIFNFRGLTTVNRCSFLGNEAIAGNGGVGGLGGNGYALGGTGGHGGNGGRGFGGAIFNAGRLYVSNSAFSSCQALGGDAGAGGVNGSGQVNGVTGQGGLGGAGSGGAIYNTNSPFAFASIQSSTFYLNKARSGASADAGSRRGPARNGPKGPDSFGGAFSNNRLADFTNCTFVGNSIRGGSGGRGGTSDGKGGTGGEAGSAWGGSLFNSSMANVWNCTFVDGAATPGTNGLEGVGVFRGKVGAFGKTRGAHLGSNRGRILLGNTLVYNPPGTSTNLFETNDVCIIMVTTNVNSTGTSAFQITCTREITHRSDGFAQTNTALCINTTITGTNLVAGTNEDCTHVSTREVTLSLNRSIGYGVFRDEGYNLFSDRSIRLRKSSGSFITNGTAFRIGALANNGGPTHTIALLPGSPAIDGVGDDAIQIPETDQRDVGRPSGSHADIGAYEYEASEEPPEIVEQSPSQDVIRGSNVTLSVDVEGAQPLTYQWYAGGEAIDGATSSSLVLTDIGYTNSLDYSVTVANEFGSVESEIITVTVIADITKSCETQSPTPFCMIEFPNEMGMVFMLQFRDNPEDPWMDLGEPLSDDNQENQTLVFDDDTGGGSDARLYRVLGTPLDAP